MINQLIHYFTLIALTTWHNIFQVSLPYGKSVCATANAIPHICNTQSTKKIALPQKATSTPSVATRYHGNNRSHTLWSINQSTTVQTKSDFQVVDVVFLSTLFFYVIPYFWNMWLTPPTLMWWNVYNSAAANIYLLFQFFGDMLMLVGYMVLFCLIAYVATCRCSTWKTVFRFMLVVLLVSHKPWANHNLWILPPPVVYGAACIETIPLTRWQQSSK